MDVNGSLISLKTDFQLYGKIVWYSEDISINTQDLCRMTAFLYLLELAFQKICLFISALVRIIGYFILKKKTNLEVK